MIELPCLRPSAPAVPLKPSWIFNARGPQGHSAQMRVFRAPLLSQCAQLSAKRVRLCLERTLFPTEFNFTVVFAFIFLLFATFCCSRSRFICSDGPILWKRSLDAVGFRNFTFSPCILKCVFVLHFLVGGLEIVVAIDWLARPRVLG